MKSTDYIEKTAKIRWESTRKLTTVKRCHIRPHVENGISKRKRKSSDFFHDQQLVKKKTKKNQNPDVTCLDDDEENKVIMKTPYFSCEKSSKLCAEGVLKNLLYMLQMKTDDIDYF